LASSRTSAVHRPEHVETLLDFVCEVTHLDTLYDSASQTLTPVKDPGSFPKIWKLVQKPKKVNGKTEHDPSESNHSACYVTVMHCHAGAVVKAAKLFKQKTLPKESALVWAEAVMSTLAADIASGVLHPEEMVTLLYTGLTLQELTSMRIVNHSPSMKSCAAGILEGKHSLHTTILHTIWMIEKEDFEVENPSDHWLWYTLCHRDVLEIIKDFVRKVLKTDISDRRVAVLVEGVTGACVNTQKTIGMCNDQELNHQMTVEYPVKEFTTAVRRLEKAEWGGALSMDMVVSKRKHTLAQEFVEKSKFLLGRLHYVHTRGKYDPTLAPPSDNIALVTMHEFVSAILRHCTYPGCERLSAGGTFCCPHGGGKRCTHLGCYKHAIPPSTCCIGHGGGRRCAHPECDKPARCTIWFCVDHSSPGDSGLMNCRGWEEEEEQALKGLVEAYEGPAHVKWARIRAAAQKQGVIHPSRTASSISCEWYSICRKNVPPSAPAPPPPVPARGAQQAELPGAPPPCAAPPPVPARGAQQAELPGAPPPCAAPPPVPARGVKRKFTPQEECELVELHNADSGMSRGKWQRICAAAKLRGVLQGMTSQQMSDKWRNGTWRLGS